VKAKEILRMKPKPVPAVVLPPPPPVRNGVPVIGIPNGRNGAADYPWRGQGAEALDARRAECLKLLAEVDEDLIKIGSQIAGVKGPNGMHGGRVDRDWWRRLLTAQRCYAAQRQRLQEELGELKRTMRDARVHRTEQLFISVTKETLGDAAFDAIWREVTRRLVAEETAA
jgi:hypothetical protein